MTAAWIRLGKPLLIGLICLGIGACTDGRIKRGTIQLVPQQSINTGGLVFANSFTFNGKALDAVQMSMYQSSLYISGSPMGFLRAEVGDNQEAPALTFAASDDILNFSPIGQWGFDPYASGAIGIDGNLAFLSGSIGLSVVNLSSTNRPQEVARYPGLSADGTTRQTDPQGHFVYRAIVPNGNVFYGFRQQDYVDTIGITTALSVLRSDSYSPNGNVCCVTSATVYQGAVMVAFTNAIAIFQIAPNGQLTSPTVYNGLQATYITSSPNYLYVQHVPTYGSTGTDGFARGIYVFNSQGQQVAFLSSNPFANFAVSPDDTHLYGNRDGQSVEIYRIQR